LISLIYDYDWIVAEQSFLRALTFDRNQADTLQAYAHLLACSGRSEDAISAIERASLADPDDQIIQVSVAWIYLLCGCATRALEKATLAAEDLYPTFPPAHVILGWVQEAMGDFTGAQISFTRGLELDPVPIAIASLGHLYGLVGDERSAKLALADLRKLKARRKVTYVSGFCEALIYIGLREFSLALNALHRAYEERCDWLIHLTVDPRWEPLREEPNFISLVKQVGIPE
jgi:tetratricopeptide (TPR) repeat protein